MNTLNNQQINPGNRVDFSRIRRFAKGGVPKYQNTSNPIWKLNDLQTAFTVDSASYGTASPTSIPFSRTWTPTNQYLTIEDYEKSQDYVDFTNYVKQNSSNPEVLSYLKLLDTLARLSGTNNGLLFSDPNLTTLRTDWDKEYDRLRYDGKYGYFHWTPKKINHPDNSSTDVSKSSDSGVLANNQIIDENKVSLNYTPATYLPNYKESYKDTSALGAIYHNNIDSLEKQKRQLLDTSVPLQQGKYRLSDLTSGYLLLSQLKLQLADLQLTFNTQLAQLGNSGDRTQAMLDFNSKVVLPLTNLILNINSQYTQSSLNKIEADKNYNIDQSIDKDNINRQLLAADKRYKNNVEAKIEASKSGETAKYLLNLDTYDKIWGLHENLNQAAYNENLNRFRYNEELNKARSDYHNGIFGIVGNNASGETLSYNDVLDALLEEIINGGDTNDLDQFETNRNNPEVMIALMKKYKTINGVDNVNIASWLNNYLNYDGEKVFLNKKSELDRKLNYLNLFTKRPHYSNVRGGLNLLINWDNINNLNIPYLKSGGELKKSIKDRFIQYSEHIRKQQKDFVERTERSHTNSQKKLIRDLDALDRETLLLLRSIFK